MKTRHLTLLLLGVVSCSGDSSPTTPTPGAGGGTTVTPVATSIDVSGGSATGGITFVSLTQASTLTAIVRDQSGSPIAGAPVTWASSDQAVATVSSAGLVTAVANGTAVITATSGSASGTASVTVNQVAISASLSIESVTLASVGDTATLAATVVDGLDQALSSPTLVWTSSDTAVAAIDSTGLITSVANGTATVTATSGAASATASVTVSQVAASVLSLIHI